MEITATELKKNLGKYLGAATREDVVITKNGKAVARIVGERAYLAGAAELDELLLFRELPATDFYNAGVGAGVPSGVPLGGGVPGGTPPGTGTDAGIGSGAVGGRAGADPRSAAAAGLDLAVGEWVLTHNGEPVARLTPIQKKKKRQLGFIKGPGADPEEISALLESEWTEEIEEEWLSKL
jgi:prevent-host-death family protein